MWHTGRIASDHLTVDTNPDSPGWIERTAARTFRMREHKFDADPSI
jgi:hypothetical protein